MNHLDTTTPRAPRSAARRLLWLAALTAGGALVAQTTTPEPAATFASVNGETVRYADFYTALEDEFGAAAAQRVVLQAALHQSAKKAGLMPTDEDVNARIQQIISERFGGNSSNFAAWMLETGSDESSVRRRLANELIDLRLRTRQVEVTEAKLKEFFEANHADRYDLPATIRYRQVVLDTKERAAEILAQIKSAELSFFGAASRHSLDPKAVETGGLVGPQPERRVQELAPALHEALTRLQPNEMTEAPVEHRGRWYLLLLIERQPGKPVPYDEVAARVRWDYLTANAVPEEQFYEELMRHSEVVGMPRRYQAVEAGFGPPPEQPAAAPK